MQISVTDAKEQLTELVQRAEAGDDVILMRHGQARVRLVPIKTIIPNAQSRKALMERLRKSAAPVKESSAAQSQDFLYGEDGLPA